MAFLKFEFDTTFPTLEEFKAGQNFPDLINESTEIVDVYVDPDVYTAEDESDGDSGPYKILWRVEEDHWELFKGYEMFDVQLFPTMIEAEWYIKTLVGYMYSQYIAKAVEKAEGLPLGEQKDHYFRLRTYWKIAHETKILEAMGVEDDNDEDGLPKTPPRDPWTGEDK